jgi:hypothetical protein
MGDLQGLLPAAIVLGLALGTDLVLLAQGGEFATAPLELGPEFGVLVDV